MGAIPGLNGPMAIAIAVPLTYTLTPLAAISFLVGIMKGSTVGGAIPSILLNTPGTPDAVVTALDGYPLARKGKPLKALKMALYSSITGDTLSDIVLFTVAAPLALVALKMGPVEMTAVMLLAFAVITGMIGDSMIKGVIAVFLGILFSAVGLDPENATPRLTFDSIELFDGLEITAVAIGILAVGQVLTALEELRGGYQSSVVPGFSGAKADRRISWAEYKECLPTMLRGGVIGTLIGALPGIGSSAAAVMSYTAAKRGAKPGEKFGEGELKGIAAAEAANSSVSGANLIPLLALGIPGNVGAAMLVGAFIIQGITPGPLMFSEQGQLIYGLFGAMVMANICNFFAGNLGLRVFAYVTRIPPTIVMPVVMLLCLSGVYLSTNSLFTVGLMVGFGVLGYVLRKTGYPFLPLIIGFILGPMFEFSLTQTLVLANGEIEYFLGKPIAIGLAVCALIVVWRLGFSNRKVADHLKD
ncbi:tripartite tricarboxylate transporter permease [Marinobacterium rhizophilum]|uniref:Tripartite tricarboxylate transporter permease n=1 Tax=Marinobacterium rhizophilum TaxID=420402 RepID=A0ABY5HJE1_9GAMM|nr:tripartite tricarboxylate transporter permease [Marinobacterium rhizophilum]UTW11404.1 tripartite tricarboxylate transporter permease [Marinobacterium rhizophilum]